jgi:catechol 2,3-dioxygenase-like lactoylglutathione lyase family enzyme
VTIALDHTIVSARDPRAAAKRLGELLGVPWSESGVGPFSPVYVSDGFTIDFIEDASDFPVQHLCFRVTEPEFDAILARIRAAGIPFRSLPHGTDDGQVNQAFGGRLVYWGQPDGHVWEILTVSYARPPALTTRGTPCP